MVTGVLRVLLGLWLLLPLPARAEVLPLGEALLTIGEDWQPTAQRRDIEADFAGPSGETLMVFWWFPDEPLTGYADEISQETRVYPAGEALVVRSQGGARAAVKAAFARENADGERLILLLESDRLDSAALAARLEPILQALRFEGQPAAPVPAPAPAPAPVSGSAPLPAGDWHRDAAGGFSFRKPAGWQVYGADMPGVQMVVAVSPATDALLMIAVASAQGGTPAVEVLDGFETRFYQDQVIPREIIGESHDPVAGMPGHAIEAKARIYTIGGIQLPYRAGRAWVFRGTEGERAIMLATVHGGEATKADRRLLRRMAESWTSGTPETVPGRAEAPAQQVPALSALPSVAPVPPAPLPAAPQPAAPEAAATPAASDPRQTQAGGAGLSFADALAALSMRHGPCAATDPGPRPGTAGLDLAGLRPEAAALCDGAVPVYALRLGQDPRGGSGGALGMALLRLHLAEDRRLVVVVDLAHGLLLTLNPAETGVALDIEDAATLVPPAEAAPKRPDGRIFAGVESPDWLPHAISGGNFAQWARHSGGVFIVEVPEGSNHRTTGLRSAAPLVRLPLPGEDRAVRLAFDLDPAAENIVIGLVPPQSAGEHDWAAHDLWIAVEKTGEGPAELIFATQRVVQGKLALTDPSVLAHLTLDLRPDGLALLSDGAGKVLIEGRLPAVPQAEALHLQVSASTRTGGPAARLTLRGIVLEHPVFEATGDPDRTLRDEAQTAVLFDGRSFGPWMQPFFAGTDAGLVRLDGGLLRVDLPEGQAAAVPGLFSPEPLVWLDRFGPGASARLRYEFDAGATSGFQIGLAVPYGKRGNEPGQPRFLLHWRRTAEGGVKVSHRINGSEEVLEAAPAGMPEAVELVLTPGGVQVVAEGFPADVLPWDALGDGRGLRPYVHALPDQAGQPVTMALRRIVLTRQLGLTDLDPAPLPGVPPLPVTRLFPAEGWEGYGLAGLAFEDAARHDPQGRLIVDVAAKYEGGRAGILSPGPVAVLDDRIARTPYRLALRFDPLLTDGTEVFLSGRRDTDMSAGGEVQIGLIRQSAGRDEGSWLLTLRYDYYLYWARRIDAATMAGWDGRMDLDLSPGTVRIDLPGIVTLAGPGFVGVAKGAALHMTVQSRSDTPYGAARMALASIDAGWRMPPAMTERERLELADPDAFEAEAYLDLLARDLSEDLP